MATGFTLPPYDPLAAEAMMLEALAVAHEATAADEVPVGCVVYDSSGKCVARAFDRRQHGADPLAHAEVLAIRQAASAQGDWRLDAMTLVVTLEPCPMCAGIILMARVGRVIFGATSPKWGAAGSRADWLTAGVFPHRPEVIGGVLAAECGQLLTDHFRNHRKGENL
ncbi:nucleoside deaminase [bacterium]|nr:nucleoside deaminase [bacterium]